MLPDGIAKEAGNVASSFEGIDVHDLPSSVFACDVPSEVFYDNEIKAEFEGLFVHLNPVNFIYLQNFRRVQTSSDGETSDSLQLPQPEKLFLISPPASPPVGWEPIQESEPVVNYGLLSAIALLEPGRSHEIHPGTQSTPSVVVHTCEEDSLSTQPKLKIQQTRRPNLHK